MKAVTIELDNELALMFSNLSEMQKKEIAMLISFWIKKPRPILEFIAEVNRYAKEQGLTPEILEDLLKMDSVE
jgi:hypothetical protein